VHTPHAPARSNVSAAHVMRVPSLLEKKDTRAELQWENEMHVHTHICRLYMHGDGENAASAGKGRTDGGAVERKSRIDLLLPVRRMKDSC
jgi:hypothetical protein